MKKHLKYLLLIIILISVQVTWYSILWISYANNVDLLKESDFRAFYSAGLIAKDYGTNLVYNLDVESQTQEKITGYPIAQGELLTFNHPPLLLPVLAIIAHFPYQTAYSVYGFGLLLLTILSLIFFYKTLRSKNWPTLWVWLTLIAAFLFEPLFISILKGQDTVLLLLGLVIWFTGFLKDDDRQAGLGLALTTIRPQISIFLAIPFLFNKRKIFVWYFLGAGLLVFYSYLMVGKQGFLDYLTLLRLSSTGQEFGLNLSAMFNFTGLILRIFPGMDSILINYIKWSLFGLSLLGLILIWRRSQKIDTRHIVLLVIASLLSSPHLHYHDLAALLVPIIGMLLIWVNGSVIQEKTAPLIILTISIIFLIGNIFTPLYHILPYIIMVLLVLGSWAPERFIINSKNLTIKLE